MKKTRRMYFRLLAGTAVLALIAGAPGSASADVYAFAQQALTGFTFTGATVGAVVVSTSSSANQNGVPSGSETHLGGATIPSDTLQSYVGLPPRPAENNFGQVGQVNPDYVRGDALISAPFSTNNVAEGFLAHPGNSTGTGGWTATAPITVAAGGSTLSLSFSFSNLLKVIIDTNHGLVNQAGTANYTFLFVVRDAAGNVVFNSTSQAAQSALVNNGVSLTAPGSVFAPPSGLPATGSVTFTTGTLGAGAYQATISGAETVSLSAAAPTVPEPASLVLLCLGGVGFAAIYRIRRSKVSL